MKRRTWQRYAIGIEGNSYKSDTVEIIGARWRRKEVRKEKDVKTYKDTVRCKKEKMF